MLRGEMGEAAAQAMRLLEAVGRAYGAERLIKVRSVHVSGVSYNTLGEAGLGFLQKIALHNGRCKVLTTINPAGMELDDPEKLSIPKDFAEKQLQVVRCFEGIKARITCTCTPYLSGSHPLKGEP
ncbi:MAG: aconitase X, partial [Candidatus Bathyarchaeia archaeon]